MIYIEEKPSTRLILEDSGGFSILIKEMGIMPK